MDSEAPPVKKRVFKVLPAAPPPTPMKTRIFKVAKQIAPPPPPPTPQTRKFKIVRPAPTSTALTIFTKHDRFSGEQLDDEGLAAGAARDALLPRKPAPPLPKIRQVQTPEDALREHLRAVMEKMKNQK